MEVVQLLLRPFQAELASSEELFEHLQDWYPSETFGDLIILTDGVEVRALFDPLPQLDQAALDLKALDYASDPDCASVPCFFSFQQL